LIACHMNLFHAIPFSCFNIPFYDPISVTWDMCKRYVGYKAVLYKNLYIRCSYYCQWNINKYKT
jgi:hypothetical protein